MPPCTAGNVETPLSRRASLPRKACTTRAWSHWRRNRTVGSTASQQRSWINTHNDFAHWALIQTPEGLLYVSEFKNMIDDGPPANLVKAADDLFPDLLRSLRRVV